MAAGLPSAVLVEIEFTAGVWTDVGSLVKGDSIEIHVGRDSAASGSQPGTLDLDLDNADGRFTPDNPTSTYYPNFVEGKRIRVRVTYAATTYVRFVGRITALEPDFPIEPTQSVVHVSAFDMLGDLQRIKMRSLIMASAANGTLATGNMQGFYPLSEITGRRGLRDRLGNLASMAPMYITTSSNVKYSSDASLGPDSIRYLEIDSGVRVGNTSSAFFIDPQASPSPIAGINGWIKVKAGSYGEVFSIARGRRSQADQYILVNWLSDGFELTSILNGGTESGSFSGSRLIDEGWVNIWLTFDAGTVTCVITSLTGQQETRTISTAATSSYNTISLGGEGDISAALFGIGQIDPDAAYYLVAGDSDYVTFNGSTALTALKTVSKMSSLGGTLAFTTTPPTTRTLTGIPTAGRSGLDVLLDIASTEGGVVYQTYSTSATQTVNVLAKVDSHPTTPAIILDAEGDLSGGPRMTRENIHSVASVTASTPEAEITVYDTSLTGTLGGSELEVSTLVDDLNELHGIATDALARANGNRTRLTGVTVDLANSSNDLYATFFAVTPGERLQLSGLPSTHFGVSYIHGYVEGWTERPSVTGYEVVFDLSAADGTPEVILDNTVYGRVPWGDGVCTLTSGITSSATSISLTFTGSALLSTAGADYPLDLDINGERVTVTSAPAGGTSPRTLTVTRGVAPSIARAHSAGESVDLWLGASAAL